MFYISVTRCNAEGIVGQLVKLEDLWPHAYNHWHSFTPKYTPEVLSFPDNYLEKGWRFH